MYETECEKPLLVLPLFLLETAPLPAGQLLEGYSLERIVYALYPSTVTDLGLRT